MPATKAGIVASSATVKINHVSDETYFNASIYICIVCKFSSGMELIKYQN